MVHVTGSLDGNKPWTRPSFFFFFLPRTPRGRHDLPPTPTRGTSPPCPPHLAIQSPIDFSFFFFYTPLRPFPGSSSAIFPVRRKPQRWVWQRGGAAMLGSRICCDWRGGENKREIHRGQLIHFFGYFWPSRFSENVHCFVLFFSFGTKTCTALCCKVLARP